MTTAMRASFTLTLDDKLSAGLKGIQDALGKLRDTGKDLTLGKLERGADALRSMSREVKNLTSDLRGVSGAADRAWTSLKQMAATRFPRAGPAFKDTFGKDGKLSGQTGVVAAVAAGISVIKPIRDFAEYNLALKHAGTTGSQYGSANDAEVFRLNKMFKADALAAGQSSIKVAEAYYEILTGGVPKEILDQVIAAHTRFATAYRVDPKDAGQLSIALLKNAKLTPPQYEAALGQVGQISKQGLFKVSAYSKYMPEITNQMATMGMTGPDAALKAISALQIVRRGTGDDSTAATNLKVMLQHIFAPIQARSMAMHGKHIPEEMREQIKENAGAFKTAFGVDYMGYMRSQEKLGVNPMDAYLNLMMKLSKSEDFTGKMEKYGQLIHTQQMLEAVTALINGHTDYLRFQNEGATAGKEVFEKDFAEIVRGAATSVARLDESFTQLERRVGEGFTPLLDPINAGLGGILTAVEQLDSIVPKLTNAILGVTAGLAGLVAALALVGVSIAPVKAGSSLIMSMVPAGAGAWALPIAVGAGIAGLVKLGNDKETPENQAARDDYSRQIRSLKGGQYGPTFDGLGPDGLPTDPLERPKWIHEPKLKFEPEVAQPFGGVDGIPPFVQMKWPTEPSPTPTAPPPGTLDITIHTDPGTTATINRATPGMNLQTPNPGPVTNRP